MDNAAIEEMFCALGPVSIRRMFGGKGIYHHGVIIALDLFDEILLKADAETAPKFEGAGARQWSYQREGKKQVAMPYWSIPDDAFDDPDEMARWVTLAYEAGVRTHKPSTKKVSAKKRQDRLGES